MHNFRPGADERLGLDYETVSAVNPRLVYLYAGSYGSSGPYHRQPAFHPTVSAVIGSGVRAAGRGNPPMDASHGDPDGALGVATALLLGLHAARRNGKGQYIETRMITTGAYEVSDALLDYEGCPERAVRRCRAAGLSRALSALPDGRQQMGLPRLSQGGRMAAAVRGHRAGGPGAGPPLRIP